MKNNKIFKYLCGVFCLLNIFLLFRFYTYTNTKSANELALESKTEFANSSSIVMKRKAQLADISNAL